MKLGEIFSGKKNIDRGKYWVAAPSCRWTPVPPTGRFVEARINLRRVNLKYTIVLISAQTNDLNLVLLEDTVALIGPGLSNSCQFVAPDKLLHIRCPWLSWEWPFWLGGGRQWQWDVWKPKKWTQSKCLKGRPLSLGAEDFIWARRAQGKTPICTVHLSSFFSSGYSCS